MLVHDETVIAGSANFSVFSMQKAVELDLVVQGLPGWSPQLTLKKYNRVLASLQQLHQWLS